MQAQCILYRRYPGVLAPFKYAGYPLLLAAVTLPPDEDLSAAHFLAPERAPQLQARLLPGSDAVRVGGFSASWAGPVFVGVWLESQGNRRHLDRAWLFGVLGCAVGAKRCNVPAK